MRSLTLIGLSLSTFVALNPPLAAAEESKLRPLVTYHCGDYEEFEGLSDGLVWYLPKGPEGKPEPTYLCKIGKHPECANSAKTRIVGIELLGRVRGTELFRCVVKYCCEPDEAAISEDAVSEDTLMRAR